VSDRPKLVVGLGNPGREYEGTRHNIGFAVVDVLAARAGCSFKKKWRFQAELAELPVAAAGAVRLAKPRTFMNRSGSAVVSLMHWQKLGPADVLVVVDDADLPVGHLRLRSSGSSGGHNGLGSIIEALGGDEAFPRLRVGIGRQGARGEDLKGHVLSRFSAAEQPAVTAAIERAVEALECCLDEGWAVAMNRFNRKQTSGTAEIEGEQR
jgi:PTH1 family peptidyl-tRNA hydrolase